MDFDRLNRWLSLSANLAVIAGIIFLGFELRQNNHLLQQQAEHVYFQNRVVLSEALMHDNDLAEIYIKASKEEELSDVEALRVGRYYRRLFRGFEWEYGQHRDGLITIQRFDVWTNFINENKYARENWDWFVEFAASEDFVRFMDESSLTQIP
jgi:hypothetical protein